jgi:hypothetical protein
MNTETLSALEILAEARDWTADCRQLTDASGLTDADVIRYVERHYPGGYETFEREVGVYTQL